MGNNSSSDSEDELQDEESTSATQHDENEAAATFDVQSLFDHAGLCTALSRVKYETAENLLQQHKPYLVGWLEEQLAKNEIVLSRSTFLDVLKSQGVAEGDALQTFNLLDSEKNGEMDTARLLETLKSSSSGTIVDLGHILHTLHNCSYTPGFIDLYAEHKDRLGHRGSMLLNFLLRNRAPVVSLPYPHLTGFNNTMDMRLLALKHLLKESAYQQQDRVMSKDKEELKPIKRCFKSIEVSSNKSDADKLTDGEPSCYWQSNGPEKAHWIRLRMRKNVAIKRLSVIASDESYRPQWITVSVGNSFQSLREIKSMKIKVAGEVVVLENCKKFFPVVQINLQGSKNDEFEARIHRIKALGHRIKDINVSVTDASVSWYFHMTSATAIASMPLAPHLQPMLLDHSLDALRHMAPLSLCSNSSDNPAFLSDHMLNAIGLFLTRIAVDQEGKILGEGLLSQLAFNMARGNIAAVLRNLICLQKNDHLEFNAASLINNLKSVRDSYMMRQGGPLKVKIAGCERGQKNGGSTGKSMTKSTSTDSLGSTAKPSVAYKGKADVFIQAQGDIQLTKLRIVVADGAKGPKRGMIFVYRDKEPFKKERHVERFKAYDNWIEEVYNSFRTKVRTASLEEKSDDPVAYFTMEDNWTEVQVTPDVCPVGQYVLVKFLEPRLPGGYGLKTVGIKCFGFQCKTGSYEGSLPVQEKEPGIDPTKPTPTKAVHLNILEFLVSLARDQILQRKVGSSGTTKSLNLAGVGVSLLWEVYQGYKDRKCQNLMLQLLHVMFPVLNGVKDNIKTVAVLEHLCRTVDKPEVDMEERDLAVIKQIIRDGATVFFPNKEAKREQLFSMLDDIHTTMESESGALKFYSLCKYFNNVDPSGLLDLPNNPDESFDDGAALQVMDKLVSVVFRDFNNILDGSKPTDHASHLLQLLCSHQTSLLNWVHQRTEGQWCKDAEEVLVKYFSLLSEKVTKALEKVIMRCCERSEQSSGSEEEDQASSPENAKSKRKRLVKQVSFRTEEDELETITPKHMNKVQPESISDMLQKLEKTFLATSVRQMLLIINMMCDQLSSLTRAEILMSMMPVLQKTKMLAAKISSATTGSSEWKQMQSEDVILRTWHVESQHDYENGQHSIKVFNCPGASKFKLEFDPRCETEETYDFLGFTDSQGVERRYEGKVGSSKWPLNVNFMGGSSLRFLFHSDSSNVYWGYKFKVTAMGAASVNLNWLFDLEFNLCKVCGAYSGATLDSQLVLPKLQLTSEEIEEGEADMQKSELWTTLFRGGYMAGKLQRSLSGKFMTDEDQVAMGFLMDVIDSAETGETEGLDAEFLKKCISQSPFATMELGGPEVSETIIAVFAALLWHTQHLREEVDNYIQNKGEGGVKDSILQTYRAAESLRTHLVEQRQKWNIARNENVGNSDENPVTQSKKKALFLLKFAGLTKLSFLGDSRRKFSRAVTVDRLSGNPHSRTIKGIFQKYPSFQLVLEFVSDPKWSLSRVKQLIKRGSNQARAVSKVYGFAADFLQLMSEGHIFQIPVVLYLQEILRHQSNFPKHYADDLGGCGLDLESRVRKSYYGFVKHLVEALRGTPRSSLEGDVVHAYDYIQACTLHFLDINWQPFDLFFLDELEIPEFFISVAKGSVSLEDKSAGGMDEDEEFAVYMQEMDWLQRHKDNFDSSKWLKRAKNCRDPVKKMMTLFASKYCNVLSGCSVSCDGCSSCIADTHPRYHCLTCDTDYCSSCYASGLKPERHADDHEVAVMRYRCDECQGFIMGTRVHCCVCENLDLCLGCHNMDHCPGEHKVGHSVLKMPPVKLKQNKESDTTVQSYIHEHVWLLFSSLALSMANTIYNRGHQSKDLDKDYTKVAIKLRNSCTNVASHCLMFAQDAADSELTEDSEIDQQRAFALHSQERIMGLLGAMVPPENKTEISEDVNSTFKSVEFFKLLYKIAMGTTKYDKNTQQMAMDLIGQLLAQETVSCFVSDHAISMMENEPIPEDSMPGQFTVKHLFSFGTTCLERSELNWANSVASILQKLLGCPSWRDVLQQQLISSMSNVTENLMAIQPALPDTEEESSVVNKQDLINLLINQKGLTGDKAQEILSLVTSDGETVNLDGFVQALRLSSNVKKGQELPEMLPKPEDQLAAALSSIFALFIAAGFPEVVSVGSQVQYTDSGNEMKSGVVMKHFPDQNQSLIIDKKSHSRDMVSVENVQCEHHEMQIVDPELIEAFVKVTKTIAAKQTEFSDESLTTEQSWLLYLALKASLHILEQATEVSIPDHFTPSFVQCIVRLANQQTSFSKQWLCKDLEILSLTLYTDRKIQDEIPDKRKTEEKSKEEKPEDTQEQDESKEQDETTEPEENEDSGETEDSAEKKEEASEKSHHCLTDLSLQDRLWFYMLNDSLKIPLPILRAMYEIHGKNICMLLANIQKNMDGEAFKPTAELEEESKKWEPADTQSAISALKGLTELTGAAQNQNLESRYFEEAELEQPDTDQELMPRADEAKTEANKWKITYSASLLKEARKSQGQAESRLYLQKVNTTIAVLYARQLLSKLLANWPGGGQDITAQLIGCRDSTEVPYILDMLNTSDNNGLFKKVVENVVTQIKEKNAFAQTACHFMQDVSQSTVVKESTHNYEDDIEFQDVVHIPGANFLVVQFDSRCITEDCDVLIMSSNEDFASDSCKKFCGGESWDTFLIPGDTLHYKFVSDSSVNLWGYKFTVTGDHPGRFETGYWILRSILSNKDVIRDLPQEDLWKNLVYVASKQTGEQRLKALHLLIKLMQTQFRLNGCTKLELDLSLLKPLWQLYNIMADPNIMANSSPEPDHIMCQLTRALTEFFFVAENLARDWGNEELYLISQLDDLPEQDTA